MRLEWKLDMVPLELNKNKKIKKKKEKPKQTFDLPRLESWIILQLFHLFLDVGIEETEKGSKSEVNEGVECDGALLNY